MKTIQFILLQPSENLKEFVATNSRHIPVRPSELALIEGICRQFGVEANVKQSHSLGSESNPRRGVVAGGQEHETLINMYSNLTGRIPLVVDNYDEVLVIRDLEVLVICKERLCPDFLHKVYGENLFNVGIFSGTNEQVRKSMIKSAIFLNIQQAHGFRSISFFSDYDFGPIHSPGESILGSQSSYDEVRKIVDFPFNLLSIHSHTDGINLKISEEATLCPISKSPSSHSEMFCVALIGVFRKESELSMIFTAGIVSASMHGLYSVAREVFYTNLPDNVIYTAKTMNEMIGLRAGSLIAASFIGLTQFLENKITPEVFLVITTVLGVIWVRAIISIDNPSKLRH